MKILENKNIFKKLIMILLIITVFSFFIPKGVEAKDSSLGGKLLKPVVDLILSVNDGIYDVVHQVILHQDRSLLSISLTNSVWEIISTIVVFIGIAVATTVAIVATAGAAAAIAAALAGISLSAVSAGTVIFISVGTAIYGASVYNSNEFPDDKLDLPLYSISPEEIFSNELVIFDVDFFNPDKKKTLKEGNTEVKGSDGKVVELESTAKKLRATISNWYVILRDIAIVALLSILVYVGIKIIISSTSGEKAKYKQMLVDWIVAICLLFAMQYIMSFSNMIVEKVTDILNDIKYNNKSIQILPDKEEKLSKGLKKYGYTDDQIEGLYIKDENGNKVTAEFDKKEYNLMTWNTNLIGVARLNAQMAQDQTTKYAGYTLIFAILVMMTIFFIFTYLKRVLYMAFLTLIAPLVAMTYPIDKMNDGKAQAFDSWFKEYIFNLLIQPMHLLLYTILVSSAFELASSNMLYSIVAIAFMIPAEKLLRKFFGFEKAHTPGLLAGPAGAAATMSVMNGLLKRAPKISKGKVGGSGSKSSGDGNTGSNSIKYKDDIANSDSLLYGYDNNRRTMGNLDEGNNSNGENPGGMGMNPNLNGNGENTGDTGMNPNLSANGEIAGNIGTEPNLNNNDVISSGVGDNLGLNGENSNFTALRINKNGNDNNNMKKIGADIANGNIQPQLDKKKIIRRPTKGLKEIAKEGSENALHGFGRAVKAGGRYYAKGMANKISERAKNMHPGRSTIRTVGGLAGAAVAGSIGLAAGLAAGDPSKAIQSAAGATIGGYKYGSGTVDSVANALSVEGAKEEMEMAYYGEEEYKEKKIQENIKNTQKDDNVKNELKTRLNDENKAKEALDTVAPDCVRYGLTGANEIAAVYNRVKDGNDIQSAISQVNEAKSVGKNTSKMGHKDREDYVKTIQDRINKNNRGLTKEQKEQLQTNILKNIDAASKDLYKNV